jgi:hypothetical protein
MKGSNDMKKKTITEAFIKGKGVRKQIGVKYDDGTTGYLCTFYPDQKPQFYLEEFVGLTRDEAMSICKNKYTLF